jgi:hypothetical protein
MTDSQMFRPAKVPPRAANLAEDPMSRPNTYSKQVGDPPSLIPYLVRSESWGCNKEDAA